MPQLPNLITKLIFLSVILFLGSCVPDNNGQDIIVDPVKDDMFQSGIRKLKTEDYEYEVKPDVKFMSKNQQDYLLRFESGNVLVFDGAMKNHVLPEVGDKLIMVEPTVVFPYGFFGTVTEVLVSGDEIRVKTKRPAPTDFFEELDIHTSVSVAEAKLLAPDGSVMDDGISTATKGDLTENVKYVPFELKYEGEGTVAASATVSGTLELIGSIWLDFSLENRLIEVKPVIGGKMTFDVDLAVNASFGFDKTKVLVAPLVFPSPLGAVSPALNYYAYFSVDAELHFDWSFAFSKVAGLDIRYDRDGFDIHSLDDAELGELMDQLGLDGFTNDEIDEASNAAFEGELSCGIGLRSMVGVDVFGHSLFDVENVYTDIWGGFQSSIKWNIKDDTKYDVLNSAGTDFLIKLGCHASANALSFEEYEDILEEEEGGEYYCYSVPKETPSSSFKRLLNKRLDVELKFTPYTLYLYPDFRDFSHELDDSGTVVNITAKNSRRMLLPTSFGFEVRELASGKTAGIFQSRERTWLSLEKQFTIACEGLKPGVDYGVYPYVWSGITPPYPAYSFEIDLVPATVTTLDPINVKETSALFRGTFERGECGEFTEKGFIYSLQYQIPDESHGEFVKNSKGLNEAAVSGLLDGATYHVRAYGINKFGIVLADNVVSFHTDSKTPMEVKTNGATDITKTSAVLSGEFYENGHEVEAKGFCISATNQLPDIEKDAFNVMSDSMLMTSLKPGTRYYVRAYMTDKKGVTVYGNLVIFTTLSDDPKISVDPTSLTFPTTYTGKKTSKTFVVTNEGAGELIVSSLELSSESLSADVVVSAFSTDVSSFTVAANGGRKEVKVYFAPPITGSYPAYLTIHSNDPKTPSRKISLSAKSVDEPKPMISIPEQIDFKDVIVGESKTLPLTISNTGSTTLNISVIRAVSGSAFSVDVSSAAIMKGSSKTVQVTYKPVAEGPDEDYILIKSDASNGTTNYTTVKGNALPAKKPLIKVSPSSITFNKTSVGERTNSSIRIYNTGNADLTITSREVPEHFKMASAVGSIKPGEYKDVNVGFAPTSEGCFNGYIIIHSDAANDSALKIPVSGEGISAKKPKISVNKTHFYFKSPITIPSDPQTLEITNIGDEDLVITKTSHFELPYFSINNLNNVIIKPGNSEKLSIVFQREYADSFEDRYYIYSNDPDVPCLVVVLTGEAYRAPIMSVPASIDFGSFETMKTIKLTINSIGAEELIISSISSSGVSNVYFSKTSTSIEGFFHEDIYITIQPTSTGSFTGRITLKSNSIEEPTKTISFSGKRTGVSSTVANGHDYVDLGLSVKWADCNVGAESPQERGDLFAYGETKPKSSYTIDNYTFKAMSESYVLATLPLSNDAVRANWGGTWRLPSRTELYELATFCKWTFRELNGVKGYDVVSRVSGYKGNYIFIPLRALILSSEYYRVAPYPYPASTSVEMSEENGLWFGTWSLPYEGMPLRGVTE